MLSTLGGRARIGLAVTLSAILAAAGYFLLISPKLSHADSVNNHASAVSFQNEILAGKVGKLQNQESNRGQIIDALRAARDQLPIDSDLDDFTTQLSQEAKAAAVTLTGVTIGQPTLVAGATPPPTSTATTSPTATATAPSPTPTAQVGQIYAIQVTILSNGTGSTQQAFLHAIQAGTRAVLVNNVGVAPQGTSTVESVTAKTTMTLVVQVFVAPQTAAQAAVLNKLLSQHSG